jgi:class 3 adenylate cyclase
MALPPTACEDISFPFTLGPRHPDVKLTASLQLSPEERGQFEAAVRQARRAPLRAEVAERATALPDRATDLRTVLIADIRGYTSFTDEHGDEAAAHLASTFAAVVREGVAAQGGEVVELRGDEALAVFGSARHALHAAVELQERFSRVV